MGDIANACSTGDGAIAMLAEAVDRRWQRVLTRPNNGAWLSYHGNCATCAYPSASKIRSIAPDTMYSEQRKALQKAEELNAA